MEIWVIKLTGKQPAAAEPNRRK